MKPADGEFLHLAAEPASLRFARLLFLLNGGFDGTQLSSNLALFRSDLISESVEVFLENRYSAVEGSIPAGPDNDAPLTSHCRNACGNCLTRDRLRWKVCRRSELPRCRTLAAS